MQGKLEKEKNRPISLRIFKVDLNDRLKSLTIYSIEVARKAQKYLLTIPKKGKLRIVGAIELLRENPFPPKSSKLTGREGYRIRIGEHRIIYAFNSKKLTILGIKIGHRRDIYQIDINE